MSDKVEIIGYGFHKGITLKAYSTGQPGKAVSQAVDNDKLHLYSAQKMTWVVASMGDSYRGFIDLEISDTLGRKFILPQALFMGELGVTRSLESSLPLAKVY